MSRPSIAGWFDSTIRIWRPVVSQDVLAVEARDYAPLAVVGAVINRSRTPITPNDGGHAPSGGVRWYGETSVDVRPRDVCEVLTGPDAGQRWEVNEQPTRPRGHHTQVDCIEWNGVLPTQVIS